MGPISDRPNGHDRANDRIYRRGNVNNSAINAGTTSNVRTGPSRPRGNNSRGSRNSIIQGRKVSGLVVTPFPCRCNRSRNYSTNVSICRNSANGISNARLLRGASSPCPINRQCMRRSTPGRYGRRRANGLSPFHGDSRGRNKDGSNGRALRRCRRRFQGPTYDRTKDDSSLRRRLIRAASRVSPSTIDLRRTTTGCRAMTRHCPRCTSYSCSRRALRSSTRSVFLSSRSTVRRNGTQGDRR